MALYADIDGLASDGAALAEAEGLGVAQPCQPAACDPVSESVAAQLSAHNVWVAGLSAHSALLRAEGGLATQNTSLNLAGGDQDVARRFGGIGSGDGLAVGPDDVIVGAPAGGVAVEPVMPEIPELTAPPVMTGEQVSQLLRGGPGPSAFQDFASHMRSRAGDLRDLAGRVHRIGHAVDDHWRDGGQQAGANIVEHGDWITDLAGYSDGVADAADQHAGHLQSAIDQSPHPQEFVDTRNKWQQAVIDNAKAGGLLSGQVSAIAAHHADLERRGTEAGQVYFAAATTTSGDMPEPPRPAPPIVKSAPPKPPEDGKPGTSEDKRTKFQSSDVDAQQLIPHDGGSGSDVPTPGTGAPPNPDGSTGGPIGPTVNPPIAPATPSGVVPAGTAPAAAPAMDPNAAGQAANIAGTIVGSGLGTLSQLAHGLMPSGGSGMAGAPLSALSGLSGLPSMGSPSMPGDGMPGGLPGGMPSDPGLGSPDLGTGGPDDTTSPAGGGDFGGAGGGGDAGGGGAASPAVGAPANAAGPVAGTPVPAASSAPSAAPVSGYGGMGMYPPMMPGAGGEKSERNRDLFPDKRVVLRPMPNTEPVFGELEKQRRPRGGAKRGGEEEGSGDAKG